MTTSYNGFKAGDPSGFTPPGLDNSPVPGTDVHLAPGLHGGAIATVLFYVARQLHLRVEPGVQSHGCWGYAFRPSKNDPDLISCHASGTAFDWNAELHPNGKRGTFTGKVTEIRKILKEVDNLVYWGGDAWGNGTPDEMHFEIAEGVTMMQLQTVADRINSEPPPPPAPVSSSWYHGLTGSRPLQKGCQGDDVGNLQGRLSVNFPLYAKGLQADGIFGDKTDAVVREFQKRSGLSVDGIVGTKTFKALGF